MSATSQNGAIGVSDFFKGEESEESTDADRCSRRQHAVAPQVMHRRVVPASISTSAGRFKVKGLNGRYNQAFMRKTRMIYGPIWKKRASTAPPRPQCGSSTP